MADTKICVSCKGNLSFDLFYKHPKTFDGLTPECKECRKKYQNKYRLENKEAVSAQKKKYREANAEVIAKQQHKYRIENKERMKLYFREYSKRHRAEFPEKYNLSKLKRRAALNKNGIYRVLPTEIKNLYSQNCFYCGNNSHIEIDHIIPVSRGGRHSVGNLVAACRSCNRSKGARTIMEWRISKPVTEVL